MRKPASVRLTVPKYVLKLSKSIGCSRAANTIPNNARKTGTNHKIKPILYRSFTYSSTKSTPFTGNLLLHFLTLVEKIPLH